MQANNTSPDEMEQQLWNAYTTLADKIHEDSVYADACGREDYMLHGDD